jgi:predicted ester cyclase
MENTAIYEYGIEEIWCKGNLDVVEEVLVPDYVSHYNGITGRDEYKAEAAAQREAFPDLDFDIHHLYAVEDDLVAGHWTMSGTHEGEYYGEPATGNEMEVGGLDFVRFEGDKVVESWEVVDTPGATLGIRGTIVEGYLGPDGNGAIVVVEGSITVTLRDGTTMTLNAGEYLAFDANGNITAGPADWTGPTLDLDAGIRFVLDALGNLLDEGGDVLPQWQDFNDALDSRDLDITFPPPEPEPEPQPE